MSGAKSVQCEVESFLSRVKPRKIEFSIGTDLAMILTGNVGPKGITTRAADLIDFAAAVYQIERQLGRRSRTNPPKKFTVSMQLRDSKPWNPEVIKTVQDILWFMGNAEWSLKLKGGG